MRRALRPRPQRRICGSVRRIALRHGHPLHCHQPHPRLGPCRAVGSAIDRRTTLPPGYAASIRIRERIDEAFGWIKAEAGMRKTKLRGLDKVDRAFAFTAPSVRIVSQSAR